MSQPRLSGSRLLPFVLSLVAAVASPARGDEAGRLHALFDEEWEWTLRDQPEFATAVGDRRYDDRLADMSAEAIERRRAHAKKVLADIGAIDRNKLPAKDQVHYDLFLRNAREDVEGLRFPRELLVLNQMSGVYKELADLAQIAPLKTAQDVQRFVARIEAYPRLVEQHIALLRKGLEAGVTAPKITLREVPRLVQNQIVDDAAKTPIYELVFAQVPESLPLAERSRLQASVKKAIAERALPALRALHRFVAEEYVPKARESIGLKALPDGPAWYAFNARRSTTTDLDPEHIHAIGLGEVKRIRGEMEKVMRETGFKGPLAQFFQHLRTDPKFFFTDKEALLLGYREIAKRIDPELPHVFGRLPRLTYGVRPVPAHSEKTQTTAYYQEGSPEAGRPGWFYANTYDLKARPKWEMESLTLHEAVPGHHLQIALAQELGELPKFRRYGHYTAFVEGWGLYAESLGSELGLYRDPYARFGQLTYEMWRAIRLVVDTGMHAKDWTRDQAIAFFKDNAGKSEHDITVEVDRYIVWPGQALAYKIGQLELKRLRALAEKTLGAKFDVRAFHDVVLGAGAVPLSVLDARVQAWIKTSSAARDGKAPGGPS